MAGPSLGRVEISLLRLVAQRVAGPPLPDPTAAARHLLAAQGQDAPGVVRSLALRTVERSGDAVLAEYDAGRLVRSWPTRGTLHAVAAEDLGWLLALLTDRPRAAAARRRPGLGLSEADLATAERVAQTLGPRGATRADLLAGFTAAGLPVDGGRGYHLIVELAQRGLLCLGPHDGGEQRFVRLDDWVTRPRRLTGDEALAELALRYLTGHGPATDADLARWSGLPLGQVRRGIAAAGDALASTELGARYWFAPGLPDLLTAHREQADAVHLLPGFDELVLGYADRSATVPADVADRLVPGGNGVFRPTVVHRGVVIGTWSRSAGRVAVELFGPVGSQVEAAIGAAVERLP